MKFKPLLILLLFALTVLIYSNSLRGDFVSDDRYFIVKNVAIRNLSNIPSFFINPSAVAFSGLAEDVYRPITTSMYAFDYFMWFYDTFGYHLENVILHAMNVVLIFTFLNIALGDIFVAFFASLLFASHPVQTEVVAWISGRSSVLFLFFYLGSLISYMLYRRLRRGSMYILSILLCAMALFSKEMALTLPFIIIMYDIHFPDGKIFRKKILQYLPYITMAVFFVVVRSLVLKRVGQCGWWGGNFYYNFLSAITVIPEYIKLLIYPVDLNAFYVAKVARSAAETQVLMSIGFLVVIFASMPFIFKRSKPASFAVLWFFITLLPVSNIVPLKALMAERFLYLPSIGFTIIAAMAIGSLRRLDVKYTYVIAIIVACALTTAYSIRTIARNGDWKDAISLSKSIIRVSPLNAWGYASLGTAYIGEERYAEATIPLMKSIALDNSYSSPRNALGFCYLQLGKNKEAASVLAETARLDPRNIEAINALGVAYAGLKRYEDAIREFNKAMAIDPTFSSTYLNLGTAYEEMQQNDKALYAYSRIKDHTNSPQDIGVSYIRMGDLYLRMGEKEKALGCYRKAIEFCGNKYLDLKAIAQDRIKRGPKINPAK